MKKFQTFSNQKEERIKKLEQSTTHKEKNQSGNQKLTCEAHTWLHTLGIQSHNLSTNQKHWKYFQIVKKHNFLLPNEKKHFPIKAYPILPAQLQQRVKTHIEQPIVIRRDTNIVIVVFTFVSIVRRQSLTVSRPPVGLENFGVGVGREHNEPAGTGPWPEIDL